jgi:hypothetical protein
VFVHSVVARRFLALLCSRHALSQCVVEFCDESIESKTLKMFSVVILITNPKEIIVVNTQWCELLIANIFNSGVKNSKKIKIFYSKNANALANFQLPLPISNGIFSLENDGLYEGFILKTFGKCSLVSSCKVLFV